MSEGFQKAQRETFAKQAKEVDIIITTASSRGRRRN
jgi:NAD(P) transhydrogenase subunit alpha